MVKVYNQLWIERSSSTEKWRLHVSPLCILGTPLQMNLMWVGLRIIN